MAKTAAERQAAYRTRSAHAGADGNGERRLTLWIGTKSAVALKRLTQRYCVTKREMIERLLIMADGEVTDTVEPGTEEWNKYFNRTP